MSHTQFTQQYMVHLHNYTRTREIHGDNAWCTERSESVRMKRKLESQAHISAVTKLK